ncbi:probable receptor-like protein kinase At2g23200 [Mercurialis annua]|uniref:probable receptor-like protein kinase At2g23200 n=1 Tax=Mercurialis annua TaxID=3986 RepID=UPI0021600832|nr:probable receptor-like protein kinase At2g23200 [Mercurialis annua]
MEKFHLLLIPSLFLLPVVSSLAADTYFINCGSKSSVSVDHRTFVGDDVFNSDSLKVVGTSKSIRNTSVSLPVLYQTARIFEQQSSYEFKLTSNTTYIIRLHFFPFMYDGTNNLSDASFDVATSSKFLLFSARRASDFQATVNEYFTTVNARTFKIYFIPAHNSSLAFVNAIEVIGLPDDFINDSAIAVFPVNGTFYSGVHSNSLRTLYRINVGGSEVSRTMDSPLWREWTGDDQYLVSKNSANNCTAFSGSFTGKEGILDIAPDIVYKTCKQINSNASNITWHFRVRKKAKHFIRFHICDILSQTGGILNFELHIYSNFEHHIGYPEITETETPYFLDFVADSDDSGYIKISVGPNNTSETSNAFLNGIEIMEFVSNTTLLFNDSVDGHGGQHKNLIIGLAVAGGAMIFILIMLLLLIVRYRRRAKGLVMKDETPQGRARPHSWVPATSENSASPLPNFNLNLKMPLSEILAATSNFDTKLLIGEGGFGKVYKGTLSDGMKVAVKRSESGHGQGLPEFQTEVTVLSKIHNRHLVSLIGYCDEGSEMILVYEFMEKGTLRDHLYTSKEDSINSSTIPQLTWKQRLEMCIGAAKGLHYLHTGSDWGIIHRDVKSTNILLDEYYVAKVADFGLSQSGAPDPDHDDMDLKGSFGYLDPEYVRTLELTYKSDVYAFGVVLLEVLCARPPIVSSSRREEINLAEWGMIWQKKGQLEKIADPLLGGQINPSSLRKFGEITERCLKLQGADRPTMLDVCWDLQYALQLQHTAVHREPHEDSTTDISSSYIFPASSTNFPGDEDCNSNGDDDEFGSKLVFSQSMIDGPR